MATIYRDSPLGKLALTASDAALNYVGFIVAEKLPATPPPATEPNDILLETVAQLDAFFAGKLKVFDLPLLPQGTEFQQRVWQQIQKIPFGKTVSYLDMAIELGDEKCIRAAASANGKNPIGIIIPCHRVIGKNGSLVGYAGDLWRKKWLLQHELAFSEKTTSLLF